MRDSHMLNSFLNLIFLSIAWKMQQPNAGLMEGRFQGHELKRVS